jgi:hypothetical protein
VTKSQARQSARRMRRLLTGPGRARPDIRQPSQIARQLMEFDANCRSFVNRFTVVRFVASAQSKSARPPAALKSP